MHAEPGGAGNRVQKRIFWPNKKQSYKVRTSLLYFSLKIGSKIESKTVGGNTYGCSEKYKFWSGALRKKTTWDTHAYSDHINLCWVGGVWISSYLESSMTRLCDDRRGPSGSLKAGNFFIDWVTFIFSKEEPASWSQLCSCVDGC